MAVVKAFRGIRPEIGYEKKIAALPYDVYTREEAKAEVAKNPMSFLRIDRAETQFGDDISTYDQKVYQKAHNLLWQMVAEGSFVKEEQACYYIYELIMEGRSQTGIVGCASVDDYINGVVKKHENTRADKEQDRINHVDICDAQTGPIFLTYRAKAKIDNFVADKKKEQPLYDFISDDGIAHKVWKVGESGDVTFLAEAFAEIDKVYIADGHHRAASAVKVSLKRREAAEHFTGQEEFNYFLSVLFPDNQLKILDYNRLVTDLNGLSAEEFLDQIAHSYEVEACGVNPVKPAVKGTVGMCLDGEWYKLTYKEGTGAPEANDDNPVNRLDVQQLEKEVLTPILGIKDVKTDSRISFLGGIWGIEELGKRTQGEFKVGFAMYPTSMDELLSVADAGELMPPKSTWFEPKLRSGLFIHDISE